MDKYTWKQRGELPVILTAPHAGTMKIAGATVRTDEGIDRRSDDYTLEMTQRLCDRIFELCGKRPYAVATLFSREYADANRPPEDMPPPECSADYDFVFKRGVEDAFGKRLYDSFHDSITEYLNEMVKKFDKILLLDIHGYGCNGAEPVEFGTFNGMTTETVLKQCKQDFLFGQESLRSAMTEAGFSFKPETPEEAENFRDGFLVWHYNRMFPENVASIQLEHGIRMRRDRKQLDRYLEAIARGVSLALNTIYT